eukprot:gnl/Chilomastix_cuspidata/674.p1 GENE.gnl/Chilomastix_cuspidata/674~~gnl/Chilomastix_cuspidata/674.p1  ORF type:complete len:1068 (-),score=312.90 gnl/Chilomastix_cuspidata/674:1177-4380(-)
MNQTSFENSIEKIFSYFLVDPAHISTEYLEKIIPWTFLCVENLEISKLHRFLQRKLHNGHWTEIDAEYEALFRNFSENFYLKSLEQIAWPFFVSYGRHEGEYIIANNFTVEIQSQVFAKLVEHNADLTCIIQVLERSSGELTMHTFPTFYCATMLTLRAASQRVRMHKLSPFFSGGTNAPVLSLLAAAVKVLSASVFKDSNERARFYSTLTDFLSVLFDTRLEERGPEALRTEIARSLLSFTADASDVTLFGHVAVHDLLPLLARLIEEALCEDVVNANDIMQYFLFQKVFFPSSHYCAAVGIASIALRRPCFDGAALPDEARAFLGHVDQALLKARSLFAKLIDLPKEPATQEFQNIFLTAEIAYCDRLRFLNGFSSTGSPLRLSDVHMFLCSLYGHIPRIPLPSHDMPPFLQVACAREYCRRLLLDKVSAALNNQGVVAAIEGNRLMPQSGMHKDAFGVFLYCAQTDMEKLVAQEIFTARIYSERQAHFFEPMTSLPALSGNCLFFSLPVEPGDADLVAIQKFLKLPEDGSCPLFAPFSPPGLADLSRTVSRQQLVEVAPLLGASYGEYEVHVTREKAELRLGGASPTVISTSSATSSRDVCNEHLRAALYAALNPSVSVYAPPKSGSNLLLSLFLEILSRMLRSEPAPAEAVPPVAVLLGPLPAKGEAPTVPVYNLDYLKTQMEKRASDVIKKLGGKALSLKEKLMNGQSVFSFTQDELCALGPEGAELHRELTSSLVPFYGDESGAHIPCVAGERETVYNHVKDPEALIVTDLTAVSMPDVLLMLYKLRPKRLLILSPFNTREFALGPTFLRLCALRDVHPVTRAVIQAVSGETLEGAGWVPDADPSFPSFGFPRVSLLCENGNYPALAEDFSAKLGERGLSVSLVSSLNDPTIQNLLPYTRVPESDVVILFVMGPQDLETEPLYTVFARSRKATLIIYPSVAKPHLQNRHLFHFGVEIMPSGPVPVVPAVPAPVPPIIMPSEAPAHVMPEPYAAMPPKSTPRKPKPARKPARKPKKVTPDAAPKKEVRNHIAYQPPQPLKARASGEAMETKETPLDDWADAN